MTLPDAPFAIGAAVVDEAAAADDASLQTVVNNPPVQADEWEVDDEGTTVAEWPGNEEYPADDRVVVTVYAAPSEVQERYDWDAEDPLPLSQVAAREDGRYYTWPASRLKPVDPDTWPIRRALAERELEFRAVDGGFAVEWLGDEYLVRPDGTVDADGHLADRLEDAVSDAVRGDRQ